MIATWTYHARPVQVVLWAAEAKRSSKWAYPDTKKWDPERNLREFIVAMPEWRKHGLLAFTINLQGGSPEGYSKTQPWDTSGIAPDGSLLPEYMNRLERILNRADELGMVAIVGYFYFGQDQRIKDESAVRRAVVNATNWILDHEYRNVLVEVNNETNVRAYDHDILKPSRIHELIEVAKGTNRKERRLLVGTSYGGNAIPQPNVVKSSDFLLLGRGNGHCLSKPKCVLDSW